MNDHPSDVVFGTAKTIGKDMEDGIDAMFCSLSEYSSMLKNMRQALRKVQKNLIKRAMPATKEGTEERRRLKAKIASISDAIKISKKVQSILTLTIDDIADTMKPYTDDGMDQMMIDIMGQET